MYAIVCSNICIYSNMHVSLWLMMYHAISYHSCDDSPVSPCSVIRMGAGTTCCQVAKNTSRNAVLQHQKTHDLLPRSHVPRMRPELLDLTDLLHRIALQIQMKSLERSASAPRPQSFSEVSKRLAGGGGTNHRRIHIEPGDEVNQTWSRMVKGCGTVAMVVTCLRQ